MTIKTAEGTLAPDVAGELDVAYQRVKPFVSAERVWRRMLTEADRRKLGGDLEKAYGQHGTVGMWIKRRGVSIQRGVLDVAHEIGFLDPQTYRWLLSELGEKYKPRKTRQIHPRWDSETGSLWLDDHIIRDVRIFRGCTNIQQILDAFQKARWASRIDNPLPSCGQEETHQVVFRLNRGLAEIRFHVQKGGRAITWTHA